MGALNATRLPNDERRRKPAATWFRIGEGPFEHGQLTERLTLVPDHDDHGTIQPALTMPYAEYKKAISDTRDRWVSGEGDDDR
jgi:hypothetical protein